MSIEAHLVELQRRHSALERKIDDARLHPSVNALDLASMKRKKLSLKDQITKLSLNGELQ